MGVGREEIKKWLDNAEKLKYKYVLVFMDWFDYGCYPIYCTDGLDAVHKTEEELKSGNRFMEAYCLFEDVEAQLMESRANHMPTE